MREMLIGQLLGAFVIERLAAYKIHRNHRNFLLLFEPETPSHRVYQVFYGLFALLPIICGFEALLDPLPLDFVPKLCGFALLTLGLALKWWARESLGRFWSQGGYVIRGSERIARGPYRFLAHPEYMGMGLEGLGLGAICGAPYTLGVLGLFFSWAISHLVRVEHAVVRSRLSLRPQS